MSNNERLILSIFAEMSDYAIERGFKAPCFIEVDRQWCFAVTGKEKCHFGPKDGMNIDLPPFSWAVWFNGWLAGVGNPFEGEIAACDAANELTFSQAIGGQYIAKAEGGGA